MQRMPFRRLNTRVRLMSVAVLSCYAAVPAEAQNTLLSAAEMQKQQIAIQSVKADDLKQYIGSFKATDVANGVTVDNLTSRTMATAASFHVLSGQTFTINQGVSDVFMVKVTGIDSGSSKIFQQSVIEGRITSNGKGMFGLINPAGTIIKPGAVIDVGRFVAALGITDTDFLAGRLNFHSSDGSGKIVNQGTIETPSGGSVYLVGTEVSNEGSGIIKTPQGETILAAGEKVELIDTGTPGVKVRITGQPGNVTNLGKILADAGRIGMVGAMVRNSGMLNVASGIADLDGNIDPLKVVAEGGRVFLKASQDTYVDGKGRIVATGTRGGRVEVLGDRVAVTDEAEIDASGAYGGGTILVGGDFQGKNPDVQNATITYFSPNAKLKADATDNGDGGKVIVWADDITRAYGNISARGGAFGGNGGFVEVSGKRYLDFNAQVNALAPHGKTGTLLLDPGSMFIDDAIWASSYQGLGADLILETDSSGSGDITFSGSGANNTFGHNLSILAYGGGSSTGNINFNNFKLDVTGNVTMAAGWDGQSTAAPAVIQDKGSIWIGGGGDTNVPGSVTATGDILLKAGNSIGIDYIRAVGDVTVQAGRAIWDNNWRIPGATNISAGGGVNLSSALGWDWNQCSNHNCVAISADVAGSPVSIQATANGSYGGIRIGVAGDAPVVFLHDNSTSLAYNSVELRASGSVNTGESSYSGKRVYIDAGQDLTYNGGIAGYQDSLSELGLMAGRNLIVNNPTPVTSQFTGLFGGNSVTINDNVSSSGFVVFGSGVVEKKDEIEAPSQLGDIPLVTGGTVTITNATVSGATGVGFLTGSLVMDGATVQSSAGSVYGAIANDLRLNAGATISSAGSVSLALRGSDSTIYLNDAATYVSPSKIEAEGSINVKFIGRFSGGIVIDGESTTTTANGSGFYVGGAPATPGAGLNITYAQTLPPQTTSALITAILSSATGGTPPPPIVIPTGSGNGALAGGGGSAGGGDNEFGGSASSSDSGDGPDKDKDMDKPGDSGSGKDGDKPSGKKTVGKCSA